MGTLHEIEISLSLSKALLEYIMITHLCLVCGCVCMLKAEPSSSLRNPRPAAPRPESIHSFIKCPPGTFMGQALC